MLHAIFKRELCALLLESVESPLGFFSEKSLHVRLAARLLRHREFADPLPTGIPKRYGRELNSIAEYTALDLLEYHDAVYRVPPLQMEYGNNLSGPYRIDLAVLSPQDIGRISTVQLQDEDGRYLRPLIGVEFGTEKTGWPNMPKHLENDGKKLAECQHGYAVNVMRNTNFRKPSSRSSEAKDQQVQSFRTALAKRSRISPSIQWMALVLHIAYGRIEFFTGDEGWRTFEIAEGRDECYAAVQATLGAPNS